MQPRPTDDESLINGLPQTNGEGPQFASDERATGRSLPRRPESPTSRQPQPSFPWAVLLVLFGLVGFFVLLAFLSTGLLLPLAFVAVGIILICGLHYIVWGWWLGAVIRREEEEDERV